MTANHAPTPTTDLVSSVYVQHMTRHGDVSVRQVKDEFDRFIAAAEQRGAIKALRDAADIKLGNGYYEMLVEDELNTRADQMEGDDE